MQPSHDNPIGSHEQKHIQIWQAMQGLKSTTEALNTLIAKLRGEPANIQGRADLAKEPNEPSFLEFLEAAPQHIREETDTANKRIAELTELLF